MTNDIAELVRFAEALCEAAVAEPTPMFRESLRTQLMTEAETVLVPMPAKARTPPAREARPVRRRVAGLTAAMVASAGIVGIVASSASAVPGEMLYPVKRSVESVELALHRDDASRGSFQLRQASERLAEARELSANGGSESLIAETLEDFASQAESGSAALFGDYTDSGEQKSIRTVNDFADRSDRRPLGAVVAAPAGRRRLVRRRHGRHQRPGHAGIVAVQRVHDRRPPEAGRLGRGPVGDAQEQHRSERQPTTRRARKSDDRLRARRDADDSSADRRSPSSRCRRRRPTTKAPSLSDITDPVLGAVLGDDNQEGLIPGLLNGLLGNK